MDWPLHVQHYVSIRQEQLERNVIFNPKNRKHQYLLTSLIKCPCGANRNGDGPAGKKYYRCTSHHRFRDIQTRCKVGGINVKVLDSLVWNKISDLLTDPELIRKHAERWLDAQTTHKTSVDIESLNAQLIELQNEQKRYVDAYGKGLMPEQLFADKMKETNKQIESVNKDIAKASENRGIIGKIDIEQLIQKATRKIGDLEFDQKKFIVERVIDKIIANPKEITIWGHIPSPALATVGKVNYDPQYWYSEVLIQLPFELNLAMPPTDKGKRGYSDEYVARTKNELKSVL